jgi:hypothetical protein
MPLIPAVVIPVRPQAETGTHEHRTPQNNERAPELLLDLPVFMGPGLAAAAANRDDNRGG